MAQGIAISVPDKILGYSDQTNSTERNLHLYLPSKPVTNTEKNNKDEILHLSHQQIIP